MPDATLTREVVMEFVKERAKDQVGGLGFSVFEDSKGVVTDGERPVSFLCSGDW